MSPEAQRIAIAKACGWTLVGINVTAPVPVFSSSQLTGRTPEGYVQLVPNYLNDLNAMSEAEKFLNNKAFIQSYLENIIVNVLEEHAQGDGSLEETWLVCQASAKLRAKSFLQTFGKWVPGE